MTDRCETCNASLGTLTQSVLPGVPAKRLCIACETNARAKWMLTAIDDSDALSEWEEGFVASVREQFARKGSLSEKQYLRLEEIYGKVNR